MHMASRGRDGALAQIASKTKPIRGHRLCSRERFLQCYKALEKSRRVREIGSHILCRGRDVIVQSQSGTGDGFAAWVGAPAVSARREDIGVLPWRLADPGYLEHGAAGGKALEAFICFKACTRTRPLLGAVLPRCQAALLSPTRELAEQSAKAPMVHSGLQEGSRVFDRGVCGIG